MATGYMKDTLTKALDAVKNQEKPNYQAGPLAVNKLNPSLGRAASNVSDASGSALAGARAVEQQSVNDKLEAQTIQQNKIREQAEKARQAKINAEIAKAQSGVDSLYAGNIATGTTTMPGSSSDINNSAVVYNKYGVAIPKGALAKYAGLAKNLNPYAKLTTINTNAGRVTVNSSAAVMFKDFINALSKQYKITTLEGHAGRDVRGKPGTPSMHSYGFAIDINSAANPMTSDGRLITNMPKGIQTLAAKYGLYWGGSWNGSRKDAMHFSLKYKGTK